MTQPDIHARGHRGPLTWMRSGEPMIWLNAAAVSLSVVAVLGLLLLLAVRGFGHFWPRDVMAVSTAYAGAEQRLLGEVVDWAQVPAQQLREAGFELTGPGPLYGRSLIKQGNREYFDSDFIWVLDEHMGPRAYPPSVAVVERLEWGNLYGELQSVRVDDRILADTGASDRLWPAFQGLIADTRQVRDEIRHIERDEIGGINHRMERLRLQQRSLELDGELDAAAQADLATARAQLDAEYDVLHVQLQALYQSIQGASYTVRLADGQLVELPVAKVVRAYQPNAMNRWQKCALYLEKLWEFLSDEPREANTEGGVYPAIFGTVIMVILMSIIVAPFGVLAAVYLREYAHQGFVTRIIRVAVNNLAGVPSIVYGVFGLGFFVYFVGGELDELFFAAALPSPTFGTPGLMWASLTLALLTLPVVIVATEEGLDRIPVSIREGSLALGATRAETLWRVVLPMASPAMMTGLILAVARAAGEVAPLMLVGVVKLAPSLPVDGNYPFLHFDQKFMHLGFHIYDVGFQSPNVEAARPLVYATALLLVVLIALLNLTAVTLRNHLRERYKSLEN
ncbi:phosphate ABC transporter permease PstA [Parahaliea maris]|uniref:Phosphate transport system permease protein PstA n=1 Tax=Parahaliea maris TaxID=2716870 RepID=A0A5C9A6G7_9GAMM|nr:phosphate ABC transporter permease PstA [Parahaliea maris]TXS95602.1 phosphate ABC transporter permease PstA [Parahaliea maris]